MKQLRIVFISFVMLLLCLATSNVKAINTGDTVTYTHTKPYTGAYLFEADGMMGTCGEAGVEADNDGEATVTEIAHDQLLAKVAYYIYTNKWITDKKGDVVPGAPTNDNDPKLWTYARLATVFIQRTNQGTNWGTAYAEGHGSAAIEYVEGEYSRLLETFNNIQVPDNFKVYRANPTSGKQKFVIWEVEGFSASKEYNCDTPNGFDHALVKNGDTIVYDIKWKGGNGNITITDRISKGLQYIQGSSNIGEPTITPDRGTGETVLTWNTTASSGTLTYSVKVDASDQCAAGINKVQNQASIMADNTRHELAKLENPLPSKCYAPMPNDGYDGKKVKVGDDIKYQITLTNVKNEIVTAYVTDILSRGLTYNKDAVVNTGQITAADNQEVDSNGNNKLKFTITIPAKATVVLSYSGKVNKEAAVKVLNNANIRYDNGRSISLNQLENPVYVPDSSVTPVDPVNPEEPEAVIPTPDTASNVLILGVASGLALVGVGGYFIYKKMKKK